MGKLGTMLLTQKVCSLLRGKKLQFTKIIFFAGFFPAEMVFTERAIPVLVEQGIEWVMVANNHISRACKVNRIPIN
jgi:hypothetical protein